MKLWILLLCSKSIVFAKPKLTPTQSIEGNVSIDKNVHSNLLLYKVDLKHNKDNVTGDIFTNHRTSGTNEFAVISRLQAVYLMANCEFAHWTMFEIYEVIRLCPLFYHKKFQNYYLRFTKYSLDFYKKSRLFLNKDDFFGQLLDALNAYLTHKSNTSHYDDTGIAKTLLSLLIKSHYISISSFGSTEKKFISDINTIRLILMDVIELQRFLLTSCPEIPANSRNSQLYGIWISVNEPVTKQKVEKLMNVAVTSVNRNYLDLNYCKIAKLLSFINIDLNDDDFKEIATAEVKITHVTSMLVIDILKQLKTNYDTQLISGYHELILSVIMKQIVTLGSKILQFPLKYTTIDQQQQNIVQIVLEKMYVIFSQIQQKFVPSYIIEGFEVLMQWLEQKSTDFDRLSSYLSDRKIKLGKLDKVLTLKNLEDKILKLLQLILDNISYFECFDFFFKPVKESHDKYYRPLAHNMLQLLLPTNNAKNVLGECDFVTTIYAICYQAFFLMNGYIDSSSDKDKMMCLYGTTSAINNVKNYFLLIMKKGTKNVDILKIAYDVSTILVNFSLDFKRDLIHIEVKRILNVIMNEMNSYAMKYCTSNDFDFFIFNNINFYELGNRDANNNSIRIFFENGVNNFVPNDFEFESSINENDYEFLNVQNFVKKFIIGSRAYNKYSEEIMLNWNGSVQTIKSIFEHETLLIICLPSNVYELYRAYFKFVVAVIFFRIKQILEYNTNLSDIRTSFEAITDTFGKRISWLSNFPSELYDIPESINEWFLYLEEEWKERKKKNYEKKLRDVFQGNIKLMKEKFEEVNIYFGNSPKKSKKWFSFSKSPVLGTNNNYMTDNEFKKVVDELIINAKIAFKHFSKLTRGPSNQPYQNE